MAEKFYKNAARDNVIVYFNKKEQYNIKIPPEPSKINKHFSNNYGTK